MQTAIIFIDEIDNFLKVSSQEMQHSEAIKAEFLTLWDGVVGSNLLVLCATDKPNMIDGAFSLRMHWFFEVL
jgi:SpoVK/Ycf46/Vps4 family AAA+-type ATPase